MSIFTYHDKRRSLWFSAYWLFLAFLFYPYQLQAVEKKDVRERCRSNMAGIYLNFYAAEQENIRLLSQLQKQQKELKDKQVKVDREYQKLNEQIATQDYTPALQDKLLTYRSQLKQMNELIIQNEGLIAKNEENLKNTASAMKELKTRLEKVFHLKVVISSAHTRYGKYRVELEFKHVCPRFNALCPLPEEHKPLLRDTLAYISKNHPHEALAPDCERYASILPPQPL
jgi:Skp family chaperone for outer membrane proteins